MVDQTHKTPPASDGGETEDVARAAPSVSPPEKQADDGSRVESPGVDPMLERVIHQRYRLLELIGRGAMGRVYAAEHISTEQRFAVKLLSPSFAMDPVLVERFRREAMSASRLRHEGCVEVFDYGQEDDGTFFIVMEFIEGNGLAEELASKGVMSVDRVAHIGVQLLSALGAAHASGILHRDLKPQNIMLTQRFTRPDFVKVVDFGIAKMVAPGREEQSLTIPGTVFGTPEYMSPEQARGLDLDHRSDLFSAAVVLWQLLLGTSPFRGSSASETLQRVISGEPVRPSATRSDVPRTFENILLRAMHKDVAARYPDVDAFREAITPFVDGAHVEQVRVLEEANGAGHQTEDSLPVLGTELSGAVPMPRTEDSVAPISHATKTEDGLMAVTTFTDENVEEFRPKRFARAGLLVPVLATGAVAVWLAMPGVKSPSEETPREPSEQATSGWTEITERALRAQEAQNWAAAQAAWLEAIRLRPDDARAHANLATLLWRQGEGAAALPHIEKAMELDERYKKQFAPLYQMLSRKSQALERGP